MIPYGFYKHSLCIYPCFLPSSHSFCFLLPPPSQLKSPHCLFFTFLLYNTYILLFPQLEPPYTMVSFYFLPLVAALGDRLTLEDLE